jgi:hypothetical protein
MALPHSLAEIKSNMLVLAKATGNQYMDNRATGSLCMANNSVEDLVGVAWHFLWWVG